MDDFEAFDRAVTATTGVVKGVRSDQMEATTPCSEWTVRALLNHLVGTLWLSEGLLSGRPPRHALIPGGLPAADLVADDPAAAYAEAAAAALTAAADGDALTRIHATPLGDMPGPVLAGFTTLDVAVHGWDLATATRQQIDLDGELADRLLGFAQQTLADEASRAGKIGPAVRIGAQAPVTDRLVAYLGRRP